MYLTRRTSGRDLASVRRPLRSARPTAARASEPEFNDAMLKADLMDAAQKRGLDASGTKAELIERLNG